MNTMSINANIQYTPQHVKDDPKYHNNNLKKILKVVMLRIKKHSGNNCHTLSLRHSPRSSLQIFFCETLPRFTQSKGGVSKKHNLSVSWLPGITGKASKPLCLIRLLGLSFPLCCASNLTLDLNAHVNYSHSWEIQPTVYAMK